MMVNGSQYTLDNYVILPIYTHIFHWIILDYHKEIAIISPPLSLSPLYIYIYTHMLLENNYYTIIPLVLFIAIDTMQELWRDGQDSALFQVFSAIHLASINIVEGYTLLCNTSTYQYGCKILQINHQYHLHGDVVSVFLLIFEWFTATSPLFFVLSPCPFVSHYFLEVAKAVSSRASGDKALKTETRSECGTKGPGNNERHGKSSIA